jgi:hypothetical protein
LKSLTLLVRVKGMKKIDDKKIKGISIELDKSTKLNELDDTINDFKKKLTTSMKLMFELIL